MLKGSQHPDRDAQFRYINGLAAQFLAAGDPVISVDTKRPSRWDGSHGPSGSGNRLVNQWRSLPMISPTWPTAKLSPTGCTTSPTTARGCPLG
jgi:hypothetical protein